MGRKHLAVCSLSFLPPLWWQTDFLPCFSTLAPSSFPLLYSQCGSQPCTVEFFTHGLLGKETPGWVSQALENASERPPHPSLIPFKASSPESEGGSLLQAVESTGLGVWLPGLAFLWLGMWSAGLKRYPSLAQPSLDSLFVSLVGCLCLNLPLPHLPPPSTALQVKECNFSLSLSH